MNKKKEPTKQAIKEKVWEKLIISSRRITYVSYAITSES